MMETPLEQIRARLAGNSLTAYIVDAPEDVRGNYSVLTPYNSEDFDSAPATWEFVQCRTAGFSYRSAEETSWEVYNILNGAEIGNADRRVLSVVHPQGTPYFLGKDDAGRYVFTFDVRYACEYPKGEK